MRVVVIHNTNAGEGHYDGDWLVSLISRAGHDAPYLSSKDADWKGAIDGSDRGGSSWQNAYAEA